MPGCPSCGSQRLKGAPLPLVGPVAERLFSRRRYRCTECAWRGWKHRMRRLGKPTSLIETDSPRARATWFFVLLVGLLLTASILLVRSCEPPAHPPAVGAIAETTDTRQT